MNWIRRPVFLLCAAGLIGAATSAAADTSADVARLAKAGQTEAALALVDQALAATPRDPQLRFRKGVLLAEARRDAEAITVFTQLIEEYPELAEPYNNLAVLYAGQGDYDKARAALEAAVRGNPAYATAYENLGDVYLRLAARAYERAQALDAGRGGLEPKVVQLKSLVPDRPPVAGSKMP
jgi:Flp pilus assembly protein TadD